MQLYSRFAKYFEEQTAKGSRSGHHTYPKLGKDFQTILSALQEQEVFEAICERQHKTFNIDGHIMEKGKAVKRGASEESES